MWKLDACNCYVFVIFSFVSKFFLSNSFISEPKVEKIHMGVFSIQFLPLILILAPKIKEEQNDQFKKKIWWLQTAEDHKWSTTTLDTLTSILSAAKATNTVLKAALQKVFYGFPLIKMPFLCGWTLAYFLATNNTLKFCSKV
jgi:hypothetical protein